MRDKMELRELMKNAAGLVRCFPDVRDAGEQQRTAFYIVQREAVQVGEPDAVDGDLHVRPVGGDADMLHGDSSCLVGNITVAQEVRGAQWSSLIPPDHL
nr:MAG TPA: hypothetical protein [Caudoviricetes sp.]